MRIKARTATAKVVYQVKVTLKHLEPIVWRRLLVPADLNLEKFHLILQVALGWQNAQLFKFIVNKRHYGLIDFEYEEPMIDAKKMTIRNIMPVEKQKIIYIYDFVDYWEHEIVLERIIPNASNYKNIMCTDGERACPPENCGGVSGYLEILATLRALVGEQDKEFIMLVNGQNPEVADLPRINRRLKRIKI
ncbi:plasmid pRiA4b ORF-3 family protein [bacterium BFN5]|nr:plasmid pRiA4b ORF-3 family protein [bacterium BFN5]QJW47932.1 plasmid pRiA4b ORF-3 family protein [bacterium BFN5]